MPFSENYKNKKGKRVDLQVIVYTRPNLRDGAGEMLMCMGRNVLANLFDEQVVDEKTKSIHLEYPERWTNILEQRAILDRIPHYYPNIEKMTIKTHSVYIIQCTHSEFIGIADKSGDYPESGEGVDRLTAKFSPPSTSLQGLHVFHSL